jgi:ATP-dependent Clp protease ATP-binding subunit ClpC
MPMQHLNADADAVVKLANEIAREFELEYVGTEHILLAILRHGGGLGAQILAQFKIDERRARTTVDDIARRDKEDTWVFGRLPGTPHFRNVMALAIDEAHRLKSTQIGSEHLLLALLREKQSAGERALKKLGVTLKIAREEVARRAAAS